MMAHLEQVEYCSKVKNKFPEWFTNKFVLDVGSLDINGNNQYLFNNCPYLGLDIGEGRNVDIVSKGHELNLPDNTFDVIISTECFEHDMYYEKTLRNIYRMLKPGGFFIFTCATTGRPEHGTRRTTPEDAFLLPDSNNWSDYYKNLTQKDFESIFDFNTEFSEIYFETNDKSHDIYFYGFKTGEFNQRNNYSYFLQNGDMAAKYPENSQMQLFYYQHDEINVENMQTLYLQDEYQTHFSFELPELTDLTHIRIDLTNFPVVANLEYVKVILQNGAEHIVALYYSNANLTEGNSYTYLHDDPINVYYIAPLNIAPQKIVVEIVVDLQPIKKSEILELADQIRTKQNEKIIQLESIYQQAQQQLQQAEQQANQLNPWSHAVVALHYDIGQDFNAEHYLQQAAKVGLKHYEFSLSEIAGIEGVRLDPLNLPAHIKLISAQIVTKDGVFYPLSVAWHNANHLAENSYSFYHDDPIWIFDWSSLGALDYDKVVLEFELELIEVHELSNFVVQQLAVFNTKEAKLSSTQAELSSTQAELSGVYNSRSWKITKPLRKLAKIK